MTESPVSKETTISLLDEDLSYITNRVTTLEEHLRSAIYGENPKTEDEDKSELSTPSLDSMKRRMGYIKTTLSEMEKLVNLLHS